MVRRTGVVLPVAHGEGKRRAPTAQCEVNVRPTAARWVALARTLAAGRGAVPQASGRTAERGGRSRGAASAFSAVHPAAVRSALPVAVRGWIPAPQCGDPPSPGIARRSRRCSLTVGVRGPRQHSCPRLGAVAQPYSARARDRKQRANRARYAPAGTRRREPAFWACPLPGSAPLPAPRLLVCSTPV